ncbi:MAG: hypothetical protein ACFFGZ_07740 [Candidatus Thorarchaeota archaeon]
MKKKYQTKIILAICFLSAVSFIIPSIDASSPFDELIVEDMNATLSSTKDGARASWNGTHFIIFGGVHTGYSAVTEIQAYNPYTDEITTLSSTLPGRRYNTGIATTPICAYIFGGTSNIIYYNTIFKYEFASETCVELPVRMVYPRELPRVASNGTHAFIFGGNSYGQHIRAIECFDYAAETITTMNTVLPGNVGEVAFNGTHFLIFCLYDFGLYSDKVYAYDPVVDEGIVELQVTVPHEMVLSSITQIEDFIFLVGGRNTSTVWTDHIIIYDNAQKEIYTSEAKLIRPLVTHGIGTDGSQIYTFGGAIPPTYYSRTDKISRITLPPWLLDQEAPEISASLIPVEIYGTNDGLFQINFSATDNYDPNPIVTAVMAVPLPEDLSDWSIKLTEDTNFDLKIDYAAKKLEIKDLYPEERLYEIQTYGGIVVANGQYVKIKLKDVDKFSCKDESGVLKFEGQEVQLLVSAEDNVGNTATTYVNPPFP